MVYKLQIAQKRMINKSSNNALTKAKLGHSIGFQVLCTFLMVGAGLALGSYFALNYYVLPEFDRFESHQSERNHLGITNNLEHQVSQIELIAGEYSDWNEFYADVAAQRVQANYVTEKLHPETWLEVDVDFMLILDRDGQLVSGLILNAITGNAQFEGLLTRTQLESFMTLDQRLLADSNTENFYSGFVSTADGLGMLASNPIRNSDGSGKYLGRFLLGKILNDKRLATIASDWGVEVRLLPDTISNEGLSQPNELNAEKEVHIGGDHSGVIGNSHYKSMISDSKITDIFDQPIGVLQVASATGFSKIGRETIQLSLVFLLLSIAAMMLIALYTLQRIIVKPLTGLTQHISELRKEEQLARTFNHRFNGEVGVLANEFNALIADLLGTQQKLGKARDEAVASSAAKSEFLANMSHEIRTPMNGVIGMTEVLLRSELSERQLHLASTVKQSAQSLMTIINDILDFSKIGANKVLIEHCEFSLHSLIKDINAPLAQSAQDKGLEYLCDLDWSLPQILIADEHRIRQILVNLIGNAIKFTESGEVVLSVEYLQNANEHGGTHNNDEPVAAIRVVVSDTGIGIAAEKLSKIFESFEQADSGTTKRYGGTGLGLAICEGLVKKMGGAIGCESEPGIGSRFYFEIPVGVAQTPLESIQGDVQNISGKQVLVVDDNETNREIVCSHLEFWGADYRSAASGIEAVRVIEECGRVGYHFDLLLSDYHMPEMDGLALGAHLLDSKIADELKVIMLSSVSDEFTRDQLLAAGIDYCLTKPVLQDDLFKKICVALDINSVPDSELVQRGVAEPDNSDAVPIESPLILGRDTWVLVAEDNLVNQELIKLLLEEMQASFVMVENGKEALESLEGHVFDAVVMDCQMPVLDGYEATRFIRERGLQASDGKDIPILALTANAREEDRQKCLDAGMNHYLSKPFEVDEFKATLGALIEPGLSGMDVVIDQAELDKIRSLQSSGTSNIVTRLIDVYLETSPPMVTELAEAVTALDASRVESISHSLKSSSARLGALRVSELCQLLENMGREENLEDCAAVFKSMDAEFQRACAALKAEKDAA